MVSDDVRTTILPVALLGLVAAALLLWSAPDLLGIGAAPPAATREESTPAPSSTLGDRSPTSVVDAPSTQRTKKRTPREREVMRKQIVDALLAREAATRSGDDDDRDARRPESGADEDEEPTPGDLKDRSGNHGYLLKVMNEELMPLADECYALALAENPGLEGLLVLDIDIIGDEEIGGLVETVKPGQANELASPILLECMRESLFATGLPEPEESGRDAISLSMPLGPDA